MTPAKPRTAPRKNASQARSRATVEALIEATARILVRDGFDKASTNRIAETAGVSVGSLYQYFPSKEALVVAVIERHQRDLMAIVRDALEEIADKPLVEGIRRLVMAAIDGHRKEPALHRVLAEQIPRTGILETVDVFNQQAYLLFRDYLERHRSETRTFDLDIATFTCVTTIEALSHTAVLHRPALLAGDAAASLIDEATRLVMGYLR